MTGENTDTSTGPSFKRSELNTPKLKVLFSGFVILTTCVVLYFLFEDYQIAIHFKLISEGKMAEVLSQQNLSGTPGISLAHIMSWAIAAFLVYIATHKKVSILLKLLACSCIGIILAYNFWDLMVASTILNDDGFLARLIKNATFPTGLKAGLLALWGVSGFYLALALTWAKYVGILNRIKHQFDAIALGDWKTTMFFRNDDSFKHLAENFNSLKDHYLNRIQAMNDPLKTAKELLTAPEFNLEKCRSFLEEDKATLAPEAPQPETES